MTNIRALAASNYCVGCGTCSSACPEQVITMSLSFKYGQFRPEVINGCIDCEKCISVCPPLNGFGCIDGGRPNPMGDVASSRVVCSKDDNIRELGSSGGFLTHLLVEMIEMGKIDGVLLVKMSDSNPIRTETYLAKTREDIIAAAGSKYLPVPLNAFLGALEEGRYAFVGLPCHIYGLDLMIKEGLIKGTIIIKIGLFCGHMPTHHGMEQFLSINGLDDKKIKLLNFRRGGYPGTTKILTDSRELKVPYNDSYAIWGSSLFYSSGCLYCHDQTAEDADISMGDPWNTAFSKDRLGYTLVLTRSERGEMLVQELIKCGSVDSKEIEVGEGSKSQTQGLYFKKKCVPNVKFEITGDMVIKVPVRNKVVALGSIVHVQHRIIGAIGRKPLARLIFRKMPSLIRMDVGRLGPMTIGHRLYTWGMKNGK